MAPDSGGDGLTRDTAFPLAREWRPKKKATMEFFRIKRDIPFMRHALVFNIISAVTFLLAVFFLIFRSLNFGVDFKGGTIIEVSFAQPADLTKIRASLDRDIGGEISVQTFGSATSVLIRLPQKSDYSQSPIYGCMIEKAKKRVQEGRGSATASTADLSDCIIETLKADDPSATQQRVEFVGPQVGKELYENGALALLLVSIGIVAYLALRFEWRFAVSAIIANLHDVVIILGFFAFFQWEFSLPVLAAVLAVLGYSVNESVVIADRIRENFRKMRKAAVPEIINNAITSTLSRTIITHGCTLMMVLSILF